MTIIASWNVNSIRVRYGHVENFLNKVDPDILLLQEIKCMNDEFPNFFDQTKYNVIINGQKAKYGVAIIHKKEIDVQQVKIENEILDLFRENVLEFIYLYDFEDNWRHRVIIEDFVQAGIRGTSKKTTARLHGGEGHGPPEGSGGAPGFAEFLEGEHPMCERFEASVLEEFRTGQPDFSKITFRDPADVLRRKKNITSVLEKGRRIMK